MAGFLKNHGKFTPIKTNTEENADTNDTAMPTVKIPSFAKKKLGGLNKKAIKEEDTVSDIKEETTEEAISKTEDTITTIKPSLGGKKKLGIKKKTEENKEQAINETEKSIEEIPVEKESVKEEVEVVSKDKTEEQSVNDAKDEPTPVTTKKQVKKRSTTKKTNNTITVSEVDESKRVTLAEAEAIMKPIVAPTTEAWEQEKKDVNEALGKIKVKQDMTIDEIKHALAELDDFNFEVLMKQQDAETMYTGTKQNYEAVKALAIANATSTNAEGRKAEAILACQNYVTPTGEVINLNEYMLLIEERYKFYQKIRECIDFKKYSLVNYNTVLKIANN